MEESLQTLAENALSKADRNRLYELFELGRASVNSAVGKWTEGKQVGPGLYTAPHYSMSEVSRKTMKLLYELNLIVPFDWSGWDEGRSLLKGSDLKKLNGQPKHVLVGLLTALVRSDRFCEGAWGSAVEDGTVGKLIHELQLRIENE